MTENSITNIFQMHFKFQCALWVNLVAFFIWDVSKKNTALYTYIAKNDSFSLREVQISTNNFHYKCDKIY